MVCVVLCAFERVVALVGEEEAAAVVVEVVVHRVVVVVVGWSTRVVEE